MTVVRRVARAVGTTSSAAPAYRVDLESDEHRLVADEPARRGGGDAGPAPFGYLLCGLAACTAMTLRMYAERKGWDVARIAVDVRYKIPDDDPSWIERTITLPADLTAEQRDRLADIAERTPVTLAIRAGTRIATTIATAEA